MRWLWRHIKQSWRACLVALKQRRKYRFGDSGIGQRDDYDSDIRSPEITRMRNAKRASDLEKALRGRST